MRALPSGYADLDGDTLTYHVPVAHQRRRRCPARPARRSTSPAASQLNDRVDVDVTAVDGHGGTSPVARGGQVDHEHELDAARRHRLDHARQPEDQPGRHRRAERLPRPRRRPADLPLHVDAQRHRRSPGATAVDARPLAARATATAATTIKRRRHRHRPAEPLERRRAGDDDGRHDRPDGRHVTVRPTAPGRQRHRVRRGHRLRRRRRRRAQLPVPVVAQRRGDRRRDRPQPQPRRPSPASPPATSLTVTAKALDGHGGTSPTAQGTHDRRRPATATRSRPTASRRPPAPSPSTSTAATTARSPAPPDQQRPLRPRALVRGQRATSSTCRTTPRCTSAAA